MRLGGLNEVDILLEEKKEEEREKFSRAARELEDICLPRASALQPKPSFWAQPITG